MFGYWDPSLCAVSVTLGQIWAWADGGRVLAGTVRWPSAIAAVLLGRLLAGRLDGDDGPSRVRPQAPG